MRPGIAADAVAVSGGGGPFGKPPTQGVAR
jgi:hypothetical protein